MALFTKKVEENREEVKNTKQLDFYPITHIASSLKDYQKKLVQKEVSSLEELREVQLSFDKVLEDNKIMQKVLLKNGFQETGIIYVEDGTPRIAYEKVK